MGRQSELYARPGALDPVRMKQSALTTNLLDGADFYNITARAKLTREKALPAKKKKDKPDTQAQKEQNTAREKGTLAASCRTSSLYGQGP